MGKATSNKPEPGEIQAQLRQILQSSRFCNSPKARDFLGFVVKESLDGKGDSLDQYAIATRALGRGKDFYPTDDPAVRMQATRVRRALEHYYLTQGTDDAVMITLPAGTYAPVFRFQDVSVEFDSGTRTSGLRLEEWPTLRLSSFRNLTGSRDFDYIAIGLMDDLAVELDHYPGLRVFLNLDAVSGHPGGSDDRLKAEFDFEFVGNLSQIGETLRLSVHLLRAKSGEQLWADVFHFSQLEGDVVAVRNELPQRIAATIAEEGGTIPRLAEMAPMDAESGYSGVYEAILLGYHFDRNMTPDVFLQAFAALNRAVEVDSDCGLAWALLSRIWSTDSSHELSGNPEAIEKAIECGRHAVRLRPGDVSSRAALAYALLLGDQVEACRREARLALEENPQTLFFMDAIGYLLILSGAWEEGRELSLRAIKLNPYPRGVVYSGLWLDAIRRNDFETALEEASRFDVEGTYWRPLMRLTARILGGDKGDPKVTEEIAELLRWKPDFETSGRRLIRKYVKFPELQSQIEEALSIVGLHLAPHQQMGTSEK